MIKLIALIMTLGMSMAIVAQDELPESPMQLAISDEMKYPSSFVDVLGSKMHYVEGGDLSGNAQVFLFLHGNPSSSYLWRNVMPHIEPLGRVIAVDLVGFGQSDKPDIDYIYQDHSRYVDGFIKALGLKNIVLVIHDWGSVLGLDYAMRNSANVKAVAMMEAIIPPAFPAKDLSLFGGGAEMFRNFRSPKTGRPLLIDQNIFIEGILLQGTVTRKMSEKEKQAYRKPFLDPKDREPIYVWPNELPIAGSPARNVKVVEAVGEWLKSSSIPKLLLYVSPGAIVNPQSAMWMQENYSNLEAIFVGYGGHYIQEDNPEAIGRNINLWYLRKFGR
jgi:haloalkane dehalogenase